MTIAPPISCEWTGEHFSPSRHHKPICDKAFVVGTHANQSPVTTCDADYCGHDGQPPFLCHDVEPGEQPRAACRGWAQLRERHLRDRRTA